MSTVPTPVVSVLFLAGIAAGVVATRGMDVVMARLSEGETPPNVAAGVLTERPPDEAPARLATVVHYLAGGLTGPLFVWLLLSVESVFGSPSVVGTVLAAGVLYALMVGFFVVVVLPRSAVPRQRLGAIRRGWAVSAAAYLLVLVPAVAVVRTGVAAAL